MEHALSCPCDAFPTIRHDEIRDIFSHLHSEVCSGVGTEPTLQPLIGEELQYKSSNKEDGARLDIIARGFWDYKQQDALFDVRVFNSHAHRQSLASCYRKHEQEKRRDYDERVREVEHGCFTPLVLSTTGGFGPAATIV